MFLRIDRPHFLRGPVSHARLEEQVTEPEEPEYQPTDRRPIQSRNTKWAESVTGTLVRLGVSPNAISVIGMASAIAAGLAFAATSQVEGLTIRVLWVAGAVLCQMRLLCNLFDGMVAVARRIASPKGELYNEVPDRVSDAAIFIGLGFAEGGSVAIGLVAALVSVFVAYVRVMAKSTGAPNDFAGPMAKPHRMAVVTIGAVLIAVSPASWRSGWNEVDVLLFVVIVGGLATAVRRLRRAARYLEQE